MNEIFIDDHDMQQPIQLIINFSYGLENLENYLLYRNKTISQKRKRSSSFENIKKSKKRKI